MTSGIRLNCNGVMASRLLAVEHLAPVLGELKIWGFLRLKNYEPSNRIFLLLLLCFASFDFVTAQLWNRVNFVTTKFRDPPAGTIQLK